MKTACVYHRIDLDGWMSAAIVKLAHRTQNRDMEKLAACQDEGIDFIGFNYGDPIPDLSQYGNIVLVDVSFPLPEFQRLRQGELKSITWIDHHASALKESEEYAVWQNFQGKRSTSLAACELTWMTFFPDHKVPRLIELLGLYDSFRHKGTPEEKYVLEFQYGARLHITDVNTAFKYIEDSFERTEYHRMGRQVQVGMFHEDGEKIYAYLCEDARVSYKNGFPVEFEEEEWVYNPNDILYHERKFIAVNRERFNPINFGIDYHADGYDGCACFHFDGKQWVFSLYNDNGRVDVSTIAKSFGGGGHKSASGMRLSHDQFMSLVTNNEK